MRVSYKFMILLACCFPLACAEKQKPATPLETLKAYTRAIKRKDTNEMKLMLSSASIKMAQQEASAQNRPLDDIIKNETLFSQTQKSLNFRNEKIDGERATIEVENSFGSWDTVPFLKEDGTWKIDKQAIADRMVEEIEERDKKFEEENKKFNDLINQDRK